MTNLLLALKRDQLCEQQTLTRHAFDHVGRNVIINMGRLL